MDDVLTWRPVGHRWFRHRAEPLLHERMWGCDLPPAPEWSARQEWSEEAGFDVEGRPVAWRQLDESGRPTVTEHARREADAVVVPTDLGLARTTFDARGHPVRTTYTTDRGPVVEVYEHDDAGRLVAIEEPDEQWMSCGGSERLETGGRLDVEHDEDGPLRITGADGGVVWERPARPWPERLAEGAGTIADACVEAVAAACAEHGVPPGTEVFGLSLIYVDQGSLHPILAFGMQEDRRAWLELEDGDDELVSNLLYLNADHEGLSFVEDDVVPDELDGQLLREACAGQPGDPYRAVLGAVARRLADRGFAPHLRRTDDFVAFVAEHDEGYAEKVRSVRAHNDPARVARWEASWPAATKPDDLD